MELRKENIEKNLTRKMILEIPICGLVYIVVQVMGKYQNNEKNDFSVYIYNG